MYVLYSTLEQVLYSMICRVEVYTCILPQGWFAQTSAYYHNRPTRTSPGPQALPARVRYQIHVCMYAGLIRKFPKIAPFEIWVLRVNDGNVTYMYYGG